MATTGAGINVRAVAILFLSIRTSITGAYAEIPFAQTTETT